MSDVEVGSTAFQFVALGLFVWALWIMDPTPALVGLGFVIASKQ